MVPADELRTRADRIARRLWTMIGGPVQLTRIRLTERSCPAGLRVGHVGITPSIATQLVCPQVVAV